MSNLKPIGAVKPVTLWYRKNEKNKYEFNHLDEAGHCAADSERPAPKTDGQKSAWNKGQWAFEHAWLDGSEPPKVLHVEVEVTRLALVTSA